MWAAKYGVLAALAAQAPDEWKNDILKNAGAIQKMYNGVSKYNLTNYNILPLPVGDGDYAALRLPMDHLSQVISGMGWNLLEAASGDPRFTAPDVLSFTAAQTSGLNPTIKLPMELWDIYVEDINPLGYKGRPIIPERAFKAKGAPLAKEVGRHLFNEFSPVKLPPPARVEKFNKSAFDKAKELPGIGPIVSRFIVDSEYGFTERNRATSEPVQTEKSGLGYELNSRLVDLVNKYQGQVPRAAVAKLRQEAAKDGLLDPRTVGMGSLMRRVRKLASKGGDDRNLEALHYARSNDEKAALLIKFKKELSPAEYRKLVSSAWREGAINKNTYRKLRQRK
jgi:hypothetical protein